MKDAAICGFDAGLSGEYAVVIGAGIGGLLVGRVLTGYFCRVTIVERDVYLSQDAPLDILGRKGVPQGRHLHSMATRGGEILERYFPGLDAELDSAGCPALDQTWEIITDMPAGRLLRFCSGIVMRAANRSLLEERIRCRLAQEPKVHFLMGCEVVGLLSGVGGRGVGVRIQRRGARDRNGSPKNFLAADLVVDASGQNSRAPCWLEEFGYSAPEEEIVDATSRLRDPVVQGALELL
jgi:2-polyprenyl-6-methoxyphenol hydroxylase-like FAD-dependent oxidoreductase